MNKSFLHSITVLFVLLFFNPLNAQTIVVPEDQDGWGQTWILNLNGSQATYNNWSEGGVNTVSGTFSTIYTKLYRKDKISYGFRANLRYGQNRVDGDTRKSDDLISIRNRFTYDLQEGGKLAAYGSVHFKTQFANGFEYAAGPAGEDIFISGFLAPAYFIEGTGLEYKTNHCK